MGQGLNRAETDFQQRCIVVLGMHRSGTSAVTRVVNLLGVDIGERFLPPAPDNPKGFWEHREIHDIHEKLLEEIGSAWDDVTTLPDNWWSGNSAMRVRSELIESCRRDFKDAELWGLKEPRTCRLVKLWLPIFAELKCQPFFIIVFRDPREVASSLKQRNNFQFSKSLLLWLEHVLASERETRDYPRVFISFEKLLADWQATMEFTSQALNITWPIDYTQAKGDIESFLQPDLRHFDTAENGLPLDADIPEPAATVYGALKNAENKGDASIEVVFSQVDGKIKGEMEPLVVRGLIEDIRERIKTGQELSARLAECESALAECESALAECESALTELRGRLNAVLESLSWRITSPLRKTFEFFQGLF